ncbi:DUF2252 domain-containing protein [Flavihumibacter fluvii]|uniref:DUF2252 domain-containing protein n=1 Tax=Flavihumibacter fluvii TaxID=2838157 RepID=UPI001BDF5A7F|nr:DUF2252 domain-containing protein [Flavihumibacter fluvii]ULQ53187.1 DUF2252 domain-containing protein [Flavihumibacter fluvii]
MTESTTPNEKKKPQQPASTTHIFEKPLSRAESDDLGKARRERCPRVDHKKWKIPSGRLDPVEMVLAGENGRIPELLPLRHGRMVASPFTFYRASALNMVADLATTPTSGIRVQCCGDAHMLNFGGFATPERRIILSINDLDETLPAPFEWDIKRLTTSFIIGCRDIGLSESTAKDVATICARSYRERMKEFSEMNPMDLWYYSLDVDTLIKSIKDPESLRRVTKRIAEERKKSRAEEIFPKMAKNTGEYSVIKDQLPSIFHWKGHTPGQIQDIVKHTFERYRESLAPSYQLLLDRYELKDAAIKVVGIGSVGTACWVLLLMDGDGHPLFLQVKEARSSVLEAYAGKTIYPNHGQRIVNGYRTMQPYSDIFLGWTRGDLGRDYFVRQLRDIKISFRVEVFGKEDMKLVANWCGWALALSHSRSGNSAMISGYLGKSDVFDNAIADFSIAYADQNEKDYAVFKRAVKSGKIKAQYEEEK